MIKVLVVEDDFRIAEINKQFVEQMDYFEVVGIALNGETALQLIDQHQPDLILLDIYIPDISGEELLLKIKQKKENIDVIMITAAKEMKTLEFFLRNGIFDYLIKPVRMERLHKSLRKYRWNKQKLSKGDELEQKDIDAIMNKTYVQEKITELPKGIDPITLERIKKFGAEEVEGMTAEEIAAKVGVSRSTARRYLEYLVNKGEMEADLRYGTVGRPERIYRIVISYGLL